MTITVKSINTDNTNKSHIPQTINRNRSVIMIFILVIALYFAIFMHISGLGILAIVSAIIFFFISCNDEQGIKAKELLFKLSTKFEKPGVQTFVALLLNLISMLAKNTTISSNEDKKKINEKLSRLQQEIAEELFEDPTKPKPTNKL